MEFKTKELELTKTNPKKSNDNNNVAKSLESQIHNNW
jgi:hypothetical protein